MTPINRFRVWKRFKMSNKPVGANEFAKANRRLIWKVLSFTVDLFLIAMVGLGCYFALQSSWKKSELDFHLNQLSDKSGTGLRSAFVVEDPDRVYVKAIETDNPLEFEWQVYLPSGFKKMAVIETIGGNFRKNANTVLSESIHCIARFKIKMMGDFVVCESHWLDDVSVWPLDISQSKETSFFLEGSNFDDAISQTGKSEVQSFSKEDDLVLVKVMVPTSMLMSRPKSPKPGLGQITFSLRDKPR